MKKLTVTFSLLLLFSLSAMAEGLLAMKGMIEDGYDFWFYEPPLLDEESEYDAKPLVIYLHGKSLCGSDLDKVRRYGTITALEKGREINAYVIAPQNPGGPWKPDKIMEVVDYVCVDNNIDENRIYVLGMSLGGYGTLDLMATYPDRIAAGIGLCGGASVKDLSGLAQVPTWIIHGTADKSVPISKSDMVADAINEARTDDIERLQYDRIPGMGHSEPARAFYVADTYEWLFQHSLEDEDRPIAPTFDMQEAMKTAYSGLDHTKGYQKNKRNDDKPSDSESKEVKEKKEVDTRPDLIYQ